MRAWVIVGASLGLLMGGLAGWGCAVDVWVPLVSFRCDPSAVATDRCPESYRCCSDDPITLGEPPSQWAFSGHANDLGRSGMCVVQDVLVDEHPELTDCPTPCNPTWSPERTAEVCRPERSCCQSVELHEDDCVLDEVEGRWRPADGRDAEASLDGGRGWRPTGDSTHQDPDFRGCEQLAGDRTSPRFRECVRQLGTANQRGYCMELGPGRACPLVEDPGYVDACEAMNRG